MLAAAGLQGDSKLHPGSSLALELIAKSKDKEGQEFSSKWFAGRTGVGNCCPIVRSRDAVQVKQLTCLIFKALIKCMNSSQSMAALFIPACMREACLE